MAVKEALVYILVLLGIGIYAGCLVEGADAHHTGSPCGPGGRAVCLPYVNDSWAVRQLRATGELTYCFNARAANYPQFRNQVRQGLDNISVTLGASFREIPGTYETVEGARAAGCQVQNNMPETHGCPACGGWVHYLNSPVLIEYNAKAGIVNFLTTINHEWSHILGLHEAYDDAAFKSHRNTYGRWAHGINSSPGTATDAPTVMDFGTGVWQITAFDLKYICQNLDRNAERFTGCGYNPAPPCVPTEGNPCWSGEGWAFHDGWYFIPNSGCGNWWDQYGNHAYGWCDDAWNGRHIPFKGTFEHRGADFFDLGTMQWYTVP